MTMQMPHPIRTSHNASEKKNCALPYIKLQGKCLNAFSKKQPIYVYTKYWQLFNLLQEKSTLSITKKHLVGVKNKKPGQKLFLFESNTSQAHQLKS